MPTPHSQVNEVRGGRIICVRCERWKPLEEFAPASRMKRKRHSWCRLCHALREQEKATDPAFREHRSLQRRESGRDRDYRRRKLKDDPEYEKWLVFKYKYGITRDQYLEMLAAQGGVCANPGCDQPAAHLDHDHSCCPTNTKGCGQCVRGILCKGCNWALGNVEESSERLLGLVAYLKDTIQAS